MSNAEEEDDDGGGRRGVDISELREALGTIVASFTYVYDPFAVIKEVDILISYEIAMIDALGKLDTVADRVTGATYRNLFTDFRKEWGKAVDVYNQATGNWKDSIMKCSGLRDNLFRIAVKERLITLNKEMYNISSGLGQIPAGAGLPPPGPEDQVQG